MPVPVAAKGEYLLPTNYHHFVIVLSSGFVQFDTYHVAMLL